MENKEKIRFIEEGKIARAALAEENAQKTENAHNAPLKSSAATNPVKGAFLKFVNSKYKFSAKDL